MQVMSFISCSKSTILPKKLQAHPSILETFIVCNEKDKEKAKVRVKPIAPREKGWARGKEKYTLFFFFKSR